MFFTKKEISLFRFDDHQQTVQKIFNMFVILYTPTIIFVLIFALLRSTPFCNK